MVDQRQVIQGRWKGCLRMEWRLLAYWPSWLTALAIWPTSITC